MYYIKLRGQVIAFRDEGFYRLAKYAMIHPQYVYIRGRDEINIFDHRSCENTEIRKVGVRDYRTAFHPCKDSASLFKVCQLIHKGGK